MFCSRVVSCEENKLLDTHNFSNQLYFRCFFRKYFIIILQSTSYINIYINVTQQAYIYNLIVTKYINKSSLNSLLETNLV